MPSIPILKQLIQLIVGSNKVVFTTIHGEASSVDPSVIENWINLKLADIIKSGDPCKIFKIKVNKLK